MAGANSVRIGYSLTIVAPLSAQPTETLTIEPGSLAAWGVAARPKTLWIAVVPVVVGLAFAWQAGATLDWPIALAALAGAVLMQVISNLQNDVGYSARGVDSSRRIGLPRATSRGWLTAKQVRSAIVAVVIAIVLVGLPLVAKGGLPILALGVASIIAALTYMGGPKPIAYTPLGELTVFVFFGLCAVAGTCYLQLGTVTPAAMLAGAALGLLAAAVLAANNHRDIEHDAHTGRRTAAVLLGTQGSAKMYRILVLAPYALVLALVGLTGQLAFAAPLLTLPAAFSLVQAVHADTPPTATTSLMLRTVKLEFAFGGLLTLAAVMAGWRT